MAGTARLYKYIAAVRQLSPAPVSSRAALLARAPTTAPVRHMTRKRPDAAQGAIAGSILLFGIMFGVTMAANEASKESHVVGHVMTAPDGEPVAVETVESFATIWDMPSLSTNVLAELKGITLMVDMTEDPEVNAVVEMSVKVSDVWKPAGP